MFSFGFFVTTTEFYLLEQGVEEKNSGYWYSIQSLAYFTFSIMASKIINHVNKPRFMCSGCFLLFIAFMLVGPSPLIFSPSLALTGIGLFLMGTACGSMYVPSLPHMIEVAQNEYGYNDPTINDTLSAINNISFCLGQILGPVTSSILYDLYGYSYSTTIVAFTALLYAGIYLVFSDALVGKEKNS